MTATNHQIIKLQTQNIGGYKLYYTVTAPELKGVFL